MTKQEREEWYPVDRELKKLDYSVRFREVKKRFEGYEAANKQAVEAQEAEIKARLHLKTAATSFKAALATIADLDASEYLVTDLAVTRWNEIRTAAREMTKYDRASGRKAE